MLLPSLHGQDKGRICQGRRQEPSRWTQGQQQEQMQLGVSTLWGAAARQDLAAMWDGTGQGADITLGRGGGGGRLSFPIKQEN